MLGAENIDYLLPYLYPDFDFLIFAFTSSSNSHYRSVKCVNCSIIKDDEGLNYVVAWVPHNSATSVTNVTFT